MSIVRTKDIEILLSRMRSLLGRSTADDRIIIAMNGVPGSGKSSVALRLLERARETDLHCVSMASMVNLHE
jgi:chloramphenicol 3-O-phosphotransferase